MGEAFHTRDTRLDRTVAIKILSQTFAADSQFRDRFDREARTISQLDHPHICTLYDVGEQEGIAKYRPADRRSVTGPQKRACNKTPFGNCRVGVFWRIGKHCATSQDL